MFVTFASVATALVVAMLLLGSLILLKKKGVDITKVINSVGQITDIWVLSVRNECKEVLIKCDFVNSSDEISVHAIDFDKDANMNIFSFVWNEAIDSEVSYVENIDGIEQEPHLCIVLRIA